MPYRPRISRALEFSAPPRVMFAVNSVRLLEEMKRWPVL
jgi:hypothetical protein